jgi:hypothetical protein
MNTSLVRLGLVLCVAAASGNVAQAQSSVVDLKNLKPRQVQSAVFTLSSPQDLQVHAIGAEAGEDGGTFSWITAMWNTSSRKGDEPREPWMGNAWILDLSTRRVVWELSEASTRRGHHSLRTFDGPVHLPAGTYEAFYSAFPTMYWTDEDGDTTTAQKFVNWLADQGWDEFRLSIQGSARVLTGADAERARRSLDANAVVTLRGDHAEAFLQSGFSLDRATQVELYAVGEARDTAEFDTGWLVNADTREKIWKMTWRDSSPAGGALKNRTARVTRTLPAGRYAAFYATDDSHDAHEWNAPPPHDPEAWGLVVRIADPAARAAIKTIAYDHVPAAATIVAVTGVGDGETRSSGFTLTRPMDVRVYAIGEGREGRMFDYGWITSADSRQKVWEMRYADTEHAGGDAKNRLVDRTVHLDKGSYIVHYVTDDSHAAGEWNASAPFDGRHWGITLLAASGTLDRRAVEAYAERNDVNVIAQVTGVRNHDAPRKRFVLDRQTELRIYALGESSGGQMADYGWIEDAKTGRTVWEMTSRTSLPAGGAPKNRKFDGVVTLPAGEYTLRYETDDSHAFGSWNAAPPDDPEMWGITLFRVR